MNKKIVIIKTGDTFESMIAKFGDFEDWISQGLGVNASLACVVNAVKKEVLPLPQDCLGAVIAGSHAMVTQNLDWSLDVEAWVVKMIRARIPLLGICYGHQLIAKAMGGRVDFHPKGIEIGSVDVELIGDPPEDFLFQGLARTFKVHACHSQTVVDLPRGATCLALNSHEPHHAYRIGDRVWSLQFHPEYDCQIMDAYVSNMATKIQESGKDPGQILDRVVDTPVSLGILQRFGALCESSA